MARISDKVRDLTVNQESRRQLRGWACSCNLLLREINGCLKPPNPSRDRSITDSRTAYLSGCLLVVLHDIRVLPFSYHSTDKQVTHT